MSKPKLLLLHGWGFNQSIWSSLQKAATQHDTTAIDLPGFGSAKQVTGAYHSLNIADIVASHIKAPVAIIGWSLGGLIALLVALFIPDKINQIILANCNPCFVERPDWPGMSATFMQDFIRHFSNKPQKSIQHFSRLLAYNKEEAIALTKHIDMPSSENKVARIEALHFLQDTDISQLLEHIKVPCQFILSAEDRLIPYSIGKTITEKNPNITCQIIKQKGHYSLLHKPNEILNAISQTENHTIF